MSAKLILRPGSGARAAFRAAASMPPLSHWPGRCHGLPFVEAQSQVLEFLGSHPEIRRWLLSTFKASGAISFDPVTRKWSGRDTGRAQPRRAA